MVDLREDEQGEREEDALKRKPRTLWAVRTAERGEEGYLIRTRLRGSGEHVWQISDRYMQIWPTEEEARQAMARAAGWKLRVVRATMEDA